MERMIRGGIARHSQVIEQVCMAGKTAVLRLDQSKVGDGYACLILSMRLGEGAISLA